VFAKSKLSVTVGIPIWNSHAEAKAAVQDALNQDYCCLGEILISISDPKVEKSDFTFLLTMDARIRIIFSCAALSLYENFRRLIDEASGDLFVWFCGDDRHSANYLSFHAGQHSSISSLVLSTSSYQFWEYDQKSVSLVRPLESLQINWARVTSILLTNTGRYVVPTHLWFGVWNLEYLRKKWPMPSFDWLDLYLLQSALRSEKVTIEVNGVTDFRAGMKVNSGVKKIGSKHGVYRYVKLSCKDIVESNLSMCKKVLGFIVVFRVVLITRKINKL